MDLANFKSFSCRLHFMNRFFIWSVIVLVCEPLLSYSANASGERNILFSIDAVDQRGFRGRKLSNDSEIWLYSDINWSGVSAGINYSSEDAHDAYISYSYATELFYYSAGLKYVGHFEISDTEIFVEFAGREDYFGFTPSIYVAQETGGNRSYVEAGFSRDIVRRDWLINPHAAVAFGDYYSEDFDANHFEFGLDVTKKLSSISESVYFSAALNAIKPLSAVEEISGDDDVYVQASIGLVFMFD